MKSALDQTPQEVAGTFRDRYLAIRRFTEELTKALSPEDCVVQSMPDASPAKWHLAHTTWFFETFLLQEFRPNYQPFHPRFSYLFNSYYNAVGRRHPRPERGLLTRPSLAEVIDYRAAVDEAMEAIWELLPIENVRMILETGLHHEQQHQELLLTDIKHLLAQNPLWPALIQSSFPAENDGYVPLEWIEPPAGLIEIGHSGGEFCFDNETPRHRVYLERYELGSRLVTNGEYSEFMEDGGYRRPELWLSDGWDQVQTLGWQAPLYWEADANGWQHFTLAGMQPLAEHEPVCHISYYEADAFARWAGARLPTEAEWEAAAQTLPVAGHFAESRRFHPADLGAVVSEVAENCEAQLQPFDACRQMFGDVWEWTQSPIHGLSGLSASCGSVGRIQREVHVQSNGAAGRFVCDASVPHPRQLSQLLQARSSLAIHRPAAGPRCSLSRIADCGTGATPIISRYSFSFAGGASPKVSNENRSCRCRGANGLSLDDRGRLGGPRRGRNRRLPVSL